MGEFKRIKAKKGHKIKMQILNICQILCVCMGGVGCIFREVGTGLILPYSKRSIFGNRFLCVCGCIYWCVSHEDDIVGKGLLCT